MNAWDALPGPGSDSKWLNVEIPEADLLRQPYTHSMALLRRKFRDIRIKKHQKALT